MGNHRATPPRSRVSLTAVIGGAIVAVVALLAATALWTVTAEPVTVQQSSASLVDTPTTTASYQGRYDLPTTTTNAPTPDPKDSPPIVTVVPSPTTTAVVSVPTTTIPPPTVVKKTTTVAPEPKLADEVPVKPEEPAPVKVAKCDGLRVTDKVQAACADILTHVNVPGSVGGKGDRPANPDSCHETSPALALDLGLGGNTKQGDKLNLVGDEIAKYVRANADRLGVSRVIWEAPEHWNHVHVSFKPCDG